MKIVVHAGFPKTGSSSLQEYLASHRLGLGQAGFFYPKFDKYASHWAITGAFHDVPLAYHHVKKRIATEDVSQRLSAARNRLETLLAGVKDDRVVVLSHEGFGADLSATKGISELRDTLLGFTDHVQLVAYARNPVELYPSSIQQRLKTLDKRIRPPDEWVSDHPARAEHLRRIFGEEHCEIRIFSSSTLVNGDIIDDFADYLCRTTGKQLPLSLSRERRNTSHSGPACAILFALKMGMAEDLDGRTFARIRNQLTMFAFVQSAPKIRVPREWTGIIAAKHADAWNSFVETTSYPPEKKAAHRLPYVSDPSPLTAAEFREWFLGCGSREYTLAFADFCDNAASHFVRDNSELLRKLALHFPNTGPLEHAVQPAATLTPGQSSLEQAAEARASQETQPVRGRSAELRGRTRATIRLVALRLFGSYYPRIRAWLKAGH